MRALGVSIFVCVGIAVAALGCGIEDLPVDEPPSGHVCYSDSDCVPNDCCGNGDGAVNIVDAPDCRGVMCDGSCPPNMINCGCGIPVCRNSRCATAVSDSCL